jgi:hypothetical protein
MNLKELEEKVKSLEEEVRTLKDIEQINKLQRIYGYYLDHLMYDDVADLFTDDGILQLDANVLEGKESIRDYWKSNQITAKKPGDVNNRLFVHMQLQGVVDIDQGGQTAKGRWQMLGLTVDYVGKPPGELQPLIADGVYEDEYVKEKGIWKIKRLIYNGNFTSTLQDGWVKTPIVERTHAPLRRLYDKTLDIPDRHWPSGYKVPFHFRNPVTGR